MKNLNNAKKEFLNEIIIIKKKEIFIFFVFKVFLNLNKVNKNCEFYYNLKSKNIEFKKNLVIMKLKLIILYIIIKNIYDIIDLILI